MSTPLTGKRIAALETRQLDEFTRLLEKEGAAVLKYPLIQIHDNPDADAVLPWLRDFIAGSFDCVVFMTGEGIRRLDGFAERAGVGDNYRKALGDNFTVVRGPKPVQALKERGLGPSLISPAPTSEGLITALSDRPVSGKAVGVQLFPDASPALSEFLRSRGAEVREVFPYVYDPASDETHVAGLIEAMERGEVDVIAVTSSPQVKRLFEVADHLGLEQRLRDGLTKLCVAAVGPVAEQSLTAQGVRVDVCPEKGGFVMKKLVEYLKRHFAG